MQCIAFDSHKHYAWALVQNETGKHSSLFPPPSSLLPTTYAPLVTGPSPSLFTLHCLVLLDEPRLQRCPRNSEARESSTVCPELSTR
jgi:hypothetical protein